MSDYHHQGDHGDPTGPYPETRIRDLIKNGVIKSHHRLRSLGESDWAEAGRLFPDLFPSSPGPESGGFEHEPDPIEIPVESGAEWYFSVDSNRQEPEGPVTLMVLQGLVRDGAFDPTAKIWKRDWPDWRDAAEVGPLADHWPKEPAKPGGRSGRNPPRGKSDDSQPSRMSTSALSSLILGLTSIMFAGGNIASFVSKQWSLLIVMGLVFLLTSILAVVLGHLSLATIKRQPKQWTGRGIALAGLILGYISLGATVIIGVVVVFVVVLQVGATTG